MDNNMALTDILRNTAYALTASLALASPLASSLYSAEPQKEDPYSIKIQLFPDVEIELPCYHKAEDLLSLIETKKGKGLNEKERTVILRSLEQRSMESIAMIYHCYEDPKKFLDSLTDEDKNKFDEFFKNYKAFKDYKLDEFTRNFLRTNDAAKFIRESYNLTYPWRINLDKPNLSEKLIIYFQEKEHEELVKELEKRWNK